MRTQLFSNCKFYYRGYYNAETGFYYTTSIGCKNLYNYSENNSVTGKDDSGAIIETVFDVISLFGSVVDVCNNPTDPWACLVGDVIDLIPVATGIGEGIKGLRAASKAAEKIEVAVKATAETTSGVSKLMNYTQKTVEVVDTASEVYETGVTLCEYV